MAVVHSRDPLKFWYTKVLFGKQNTVFVDKSTVLLYKNTVFLDKRTVLVYKSKVLVHINTLKVYKSTVLVYKNVLDHTVLIWYTRVLYRWTKALFWYT